MFIQFLSSLIKYLHKSNPTPQQKLVYIFLEILCFGIFCTSSVMQGWESLILVSSIFCKFFLDTLSLLVRFLVVHIKIVLYVLFVPSCNILQFGFLCHILWLFFCTDTNTPLPLQHQWKWQQPPLTIVCYTSRANLGATNLEPANAGPSIPPPYHLVRPILMSHPASSKTISPILPTSA